MARSLEGGPIIPGCTTDAAYHDAQTQLWWDGYWTGNSCTYKNNQQISSPNAGYSGFNKGAGKPAYPLGLTSSLFNTSGNQGTSWLSTNLNVTTFNGATARLVVHYISGTSYTGDFQIGDVSGGMTFSFEADNNGWETTTLNSSTITYSTAVFSSVPNGTTWNRWNRDSGGTGSGGTGISGSGAAGTWYLYAETSSTGSPSKDYWARSPATVISSNTITFVYAAYGSTIGTTDVYLDVIS
jgi:hypothetical protein